MHIIDRRRTGRDRSTENRARFLRRYKESIKRDLDDLLGDRTLEQSSKQGGKVTIKKKATKEPVFHYDKGGVLDTVLPGNKHYSEGDLVPKPYGGRGRGGKDAGEGDGEDDFSIELSNEEYINIIFEDCELPDMIETQLVKSKEVERITAGFQTDGAPCRLSVIRSYKQSLARRLALRAVLEEERWELIGRFFAMCQAGEVGDFSSPFSTAEQIMEGVTDEELAELLDAPKAVVARYREVVAKRGTIALFEDDDLRFRSITTRTVPSRHATMVMIMDNSGSMGQREKLIARKFFLILYLFLIKQYDDVDIIPISHTETAEIMTQEEFFKTRKSGGTVVSSALELLSHTLRDLKGKTNIYVAQVSDGDNIDTDNGTCTELLEDEILPFTRYYAYVQVDDYHQGGSSQLNLLTFGKGLWRSYMTVAGKHKNFNIKRATHQRDIVGVFRELFKKGVIDAK